MKRKLLSLTAALLCAVGAWADDAIDITSTRLTNANLSSLTGWTFDDSFSAEGNDYTDHKTDGDANVVEFYSEWAASPGAMASSKNFKIAQTINLTAGTYRLEAYGFYREKWGDGTNVKAYLKAGSNQQYLTGLSASGVSSYSGSNDLYKAANAFSVGDFNNTLEFTLDSKQDIEVGIVGTFNTQCSWCIVGPMSLYKILEDGTEITEVIVNPSFETGDKTGWTDDTASDGSEDGKDDKIDIISTDALSGKDGTYFGERWWYNSNMDIHQTTPTIPAGFYRITALAKAESGNDIKIYAKAGSSDEVTTSVSDAADYNVEVYLSSAGCVKLGLKGHHITKTHVAFDNFKLTSLGNPYPTLKDAIDNAEGHTLGFENGEYAPYNNVAALTALANAISIYDAKTATAAEVEEATTALTSATWTINTKLMDAIYDGQFTSYTEGELNQSLKENSIKFPGGWLHENSTSSTTDHIRQIATFSSFTGGRAMFFHPGYVTYGQTMGYTMPLKANAVYRLSFQYAGWGEYGTNPPSVSILNEENEGMTLTTLPEGASAPSSSSTRYTVYFATDATPGNYTFKYQTAYDTNTTIGDLSLKRVDELPFADGSLPNYVPGTYPNVKITRSLTADRWATAVYPFAVSKSDDLKIATLSSYNASTGTVAFAAPDASTANEPFLMRSKAGVTEINLSNVDVVATADNPTVTKDEASLKGAYSTTHITNADKNYVLSDNVIYPVGTAGATINPYRAYIQIDQSSPVKALNFFIDGDEATGIETLTPALSEGEGAIYNVAGQRLSKMQKGINIVNGKKILK